MVKNKSKNKIKKSKKSFIFISLLVLTAIVFGIMTFLSCNKYNTFAIQGDDNKEKAILKLEVADTEPKRLKGLMGRKTLEDKTGMIFDFGETGYYSMWMKNTLIPLDMIFLNEDATIIALAPNRAPMNEELINPCSVQYEKAKAKLKNINEDAFYYTCETKFLRPENLTRYVIELPANSIKNLNIKVGDILLNK